MSRVLAAGRLVVLVGVPALAGFAMAGATGAMVAGAAVVAGLLPSRRPGAAVAMAACVALAAAALATVLEQTPGQAPLSLSYPLDRPLAADLGAIAGILLLAAVVTVGAAERREAPVPDPEPDGAPAVPVGRRDGLVVVGLLVLAAVLRVVTAPTAASRSWEAAVDVVRTGGALVPAGADLLAPLPLVAGAFTPGGWGAALVVGGVAVVALVLVLAVRVGPGRRDPHVVVAAGALAAVLPGLVGLALPEVLAAAGAVAAVVLAEPGRVRPARAAAAGLAAAGAALARPDAVVVLPVLVTWLVVAGAGPSGRLPRRVVRSAWAAVGAWALLVGPWIAWAQGRAGTWLPAESLGASRTTPGGLLAAVLSLAVLALAVLAVARARQARQVVALLPLVALPAWCLAVALPVGLDHGGLLSWSAPFVVVLAAGPLAAGSAAVLARYRPAPARGEASAASSS